MAAGVLGLEVSLAVRGVPDASLNSGQDSEVKHMAWKISWIARPVIRSTSSLSAARVAVVFEL